MNKTLGILLILFCLSVKGQESNLGNCFIYLGNKQINQNWNWHHEVQYRNYNFAGDLEQLLLRTGVGYNLTEKNNNVLLGYGYIRSENYNSNSKEKFNVNEHRIYQEFTTKQKIASVYLKHRYRFEERFVETNFKFRFRYFLAFKIPLFKKELIENTPYISAYNEIFLNAKNNIFDRNRIYGGFGYKVNSKMSFEIGYLNQFLNGFSRDQLNVLALIQL